MKIYLKPPQESRGLQRIADALVRYKPEWVEIVTDERDANLIIIYAIGRFNRIVSQIEHLLRVGQKYAVIQVCLRSTMTPDTESWMWNVWDRAEVVWSYYDLQQALHDDAVPSDDSSRLYPAIANFYHSPLGADAEVFYPRGMPKDFVIASSGLSRLSESVRECALAAREVGKLAFHLGPANGYDNVVSLQGISDEELAHRYSSCEFVSGLRRKEGFELPAIEGLLCGARPIVFKGADWEWNYGHHAIYIEETDRQGVIDQLVQLFKHGAPPVSEEERERAVKRYSWETIIKGFYDRVCPQGE